MATPEDAVSFDAILDPKEELDFLLPCEGTLLEYSEQIDTYDLSLLAEATALGLTIMSGDGRDDAKTDNDMSVLFWLTIDDAYKTNAAFDDPGTSLPIEFTIVTNSTPARTRQRTFLVKVKQQ